MEDRRLLASFYVDQSTDFIETTNGGGTPGVVDNGDAVTFNPSGGTQTSQAGLTFGTDAFGAIQDAVNAAAPGDTINVAQGTFSELVTVNKQLFLRGNQFGVDGRAAARSAALPTTETVVDGSAGTTSFNITASDVVLDGFTVQNATNTNQFGFGIVLGAGTAGSEVRNNIIQNNIAGLSLANNSGANQTVLERNLFRNNNQPGPVSGTGIYTDQFVAGGTLTNVLIDNNTFSGNSGPAVNLASSQPGSQSNITVSNNTMTNNGNGVLFFNTTNSSIIGNTITGSVGSQVGIFDGSNGITIASNVIENGGGRGIRVIDFGGGPNSNITINKNSIQNNAGNGLDVASGAYTGTLTATCNWWGSITGPTIATNPGGSGQTIADPDGVVDFQPWLVYAPDADAATPGVQFVTGFTVPAQVAGFTSTNNNYRRLVNAIDCLQPGQNVTLSGTFDWTEANAAAAWALGNDGVASTADDYSLLVPANINNVTLTAASLGSARIQGPGDLAAVNLEGVFVFDGGDNQGWTISNLEIFDFDLSIGMFSGAGGSDAFNNTTITNNHLRIPADLNATAAPADVNQNIGIHFSFGTNQIISNNTIDIAGNGVSDSGAATVASSVGMQSNTSGGNVYNGLLIDNNTLNILNAQSADPERILGIWENAQAHSSNITVSNNDFLNLAGGNNPALNLQRAFRVTSHSSAATTVAYTGNTAVGANIGFEWLNGTNFTGNQAIRLWQNTLTNNATGVLVQSSGIANLFQNTITGSGAGGGVHVVTGSLTASGPVANAVEQNFISSGSGDGILIDATAGTIGSIFNNDLSGNIGFGLNNGTSATILAEFNWWGSNTPAGVAAEVNGPADVDPWLTIGTDTAPATPGFQGNLSIITSGTTTFITGTPGDDTLIINATSENDATFILITPGGTFTGTLTDVTRLEFFGLGGNDLLTINNPAGALFAPSNGIFYDGGGQAGDRLEDLGGSSTSGSYAVGPGVGDGVLTHTGAFTQTITFTGLAPTTDTVAELDFTIDATAAANAITVDNGVLPADGLIRVSIDAFEPISFSNKTNVDVNGLGGGDSFRMNYTETATGLATLDLFGHSATGAGDDNAADLFQLDATGGAILNSFFGQGGADGFSNDAQALVPPFPASNANLDNLTGIINIDGGGQAGDSARLHDFNDLTADNVTITSTQITGATSATINYAGLGTLMFEGSRGGDTIDVLSTAAATSYLITGNGGGDTITVGNQSAQFNSVFDGSLAAILGPVLFTGEFNPASPGAVDTLNIDASGDAALAGAASIDINPAFTYTWFASSDSGAATELLNFAPAAIRYRHTVSSATTPDATYNNRIEFVNVLASLGDDNITVNATTATNMTALDAYLGDDTVTIDGDDLSAANLFLGNAGIDRFVLNITADLGATSFATLTSLEIRGDAPDATSTRDSLEILDASPQVRGLVFDYQDIDGAVDIEPAGGVGSGTGLGAGAEDINVLVRTMETLIYRGGAGNNDTARIEGTSGADDLTVAPLSLDSALVFLGGNPWDGPADPEPFAAAFPGVADGGTGPDIQLRALSTTGLSVDGGGGTNRLYVYGTSEADLVDAATTVDPFDPAAPPANGFGFGTGVIVPGFANASRPGGPLADAYDEVLVTDSQVRFVVDQAAGAPVDVAIQVNIDAADFVQPGAIPAQPAGLTVNTGDEALPGPDGIADDIRATASLNFKIQVNGGDPVPAFAPNGDRLRIASAGPINIFSDKTSPPTVTVQTGPSPFGVQFSSIERLDLDASPLNGVVNLIGDNNNPAVDQTDNFVVRGEDVDGDGDGTNEMVVFINGSGPIFINNVEFLNVYGFDQDPVGGLDDDSVGAAASNIDTLELTAYADNADNAGSGVGGHPPRGWGIDVFFNEGNPVGADGAQADLIVFHTSAGFGGGGSVSEDIAVVPSGPDNGEIRDTNAADGSVIVILQYVGNTDIIVLDDDGSLSDTDSLTLRGTNPEDSPNTSGNETVTADFTAAGDVANPLVTVADGASILYRLRNFTGFGGISFELLDGNDVMTLNSGTVQIDIDAGRGNDTLNASASTAALILRGDEGDDTLTGGAGNDTLFGGSGNDILVGGAGNDTAYGEDGNDIFGNATLTPDGVANDAGVDSNFGGEGFDNFVWEPGDGADINNGGNDAADIFRFFGNAAANVFTLQSGGTPTHFNALIGAVNIDNHGIEDVIVDGQGGADSFTVNDLFATEVVSINLLLGAAGSANPVTINGRNVADNLVISTAGAGLANIQGLRYTVNLAQAETIDGLTINGNNGDDSMTVGAGANAVLNLTLNGNDGNDVITASATLASAATVMTLNGNDGNDTLIGGGDNDTMDGGTGDDLLLVSDGADTMVGGAGFDTIRYSGNNGANTLTLAPQVGSVITVAGVNTGSIDVTAAPSVERVEVFGLDGNDAIVVSITTPGIAKVVDAGGGNDSVNLSGSVDATIFGGDGNDLLIGSPAADEIYGGRGNDTIIGGAGVDVEYGEDGDDLFGDQLLGVGGISNGVSDDGGADQMFGGTGSDRFIWDPGDGSDTLEGGAGESDQLIFFGSAGAETFAFTQVGTRLSFTRSVGAITIDAAGIDQVTLQTGGGADIVNINDISQADVRSIDINLANADGTADGAVDTATIFGREVADSVVILAPSASLLAITGLKYDISIRNAAAANDVFTFNAVGGNDTVVTGDDLTAQFLTANFTVNGGLGNDTMSGYGTLNGDAGDDTLVGGSLTNVISGGTGNDTMNGGGGDDALNGNDGNDAFIGGAGNDTIDGGNDYDTILVLGTPSNDTITANQTADTAVTYTVTPTVGTASIETDTLVLVGGVRTVEELRILADAGDDNIVVTAVDALGIDAAVNSLLFNVDGGSATTRDRLSVQDNGTGDLVLYRQGTTPDSGSVSIGPGNAESLETVFTNIERVDPIAAAGGAIRFFKLDTLEWNDDIANATHLGADETINVDPNIDPGLVVIPGFAPLPADNDFFRIVAERTGTLDIQVYFSQLTSVSGGLRPGLPNAGNLDVELYDADGTLIVNGLGGPAPNPNFGLNEATDNERIRIPAVAGQTYYLRVFPNGTAINTYSITTINTAAPVPFDIELLDTPLNTATNATTGAPGATAMGLSSDTGRSRFDDITYDNDPTILIRVPHVVQVLGVSFLEDIPANGSGAPGSPPDETILIPFVTSTLTNAPSAGFRVAVFVTENNTTDAVFAGYAQPIVGRPGVFTFTFANDALAPDGSYFISSSVEMIDPTAPDQNQGFGELAQSLEAIVDTILPPASFGSPGVANDGLILSDECPTAFINLTNVARPTFWGRAEADTVINLYLDSNANGLFEPATDVFLGQTVATPFDGGDQYPNGYWEIESRLSLNDPSLVPPLPFDGPRTLFLTAEDVAGNITGSPTAVVQTTLQIVIDTQGPQVTNVQITGSPAYNLFGLKPDNAPQGPTPLVDSITISFQDLPNRVAGTLYEALLAGTVVPGNFHVVGDYNGIIPIADIILVNTPPVAGAPATATVELVFANPLPDDRFTLIIEDAVTDPLCNALNGESNASEPNGNPDFPSGDEHNGGDFVARFTVDSRPEVGTWGAGAAWIDTNGNTTFDQNNLDYVNRDITYYMGYTSDNLFAGNFVRLPGGVADGFDKLAAYGKVGSAWRVLVDVDNDGVITPGVDIAKVQTVPGINGVPVAGNFDGIAANGDEIGVFTGTRWYLDTDHDFDVSDAGGHVEVAWAENGYPVVGNYDGVAGDDLATYRDNTFFLDFGRNGTINATFRFGFPTPNNRPVSADMDQDGNDDLGLFVPNRAGVSPSEDAEWYILVSGGAPISSRIHADPIDGVPVIDYKPVPFGNDLYIEYGDQFGLPILGNFDPPVTPGGSASVDFPSSNPNNSLDVNNDGFVTPLDALLVINEINTNDSHALDTDGFHTAPFFDTDKDNVVSPHDVLLVINYLNQPLAGSAGAEGEDEVDAVTAAHDSIFGDLGANAPDTSSSDAGIISLLADEQVRAKRSRQAE